MPTKVSLPTALAGLCLAGAAACALAGNPISGPAYVVDGDTLRIGGERIRLFGIDAPERSQTCEGIGLTPKVEEAGRVSWPETRSTYECGRDATAVMVELTRGRQVTCEPRDRDRYGRTVAVCRTEQGDINAAMVRRGWAVVVRRYAKGAYEAEEAAARREHLGVWSGRFEMPEAYRHRR